MSQPTCGPTTARIVAAARDLRRNSTEAERQLWEQLRGHRLAGCKFRRQHPYQSFILDFFCVEARLAIELDGPIHSHPDEAASDARRRAFLECEGIRVIRFGNDEIASNMPGVLSRILDAAAAHPSGASHNDPSSS